MGIMSIVKSVIEHFSKAGKHDIIRGDNPIADRKRHIQDHV